MKHRYLLLLLKRLRVKPSVNQDRSLFLKKVRSFLIRVTHFIHISTEVSSILRTSLIHAIGTTLSELPPSTYPISSTTFYTTYILPSRPAYLFPSHSTTTASTTSAAPDPIIDIKHSSHKSLTHFLKSVEKEGLLRLKDVSKANKELQILAVFPLHDLVLSHEHYRTIGEVDARREKREGRQREEREREEEGRRGLKVEELWRPSGVSGEFFRAIDKE